MAVGKKSKEIKNGNSLAFPLPACNFPSIAMPSIGNWGI
jgi:hypothetical protein